MTGEGMRSAEAADADGRTSLASEVLNMLQRRGDSLATAESLTGGLLAAALTDVAGSSAVFRGGIVAYSNAVKRELLAVDADVLRRHGAVSAETVAEMAAHAAELFVSSWALATTGVAGPDGQEGQPVGTVYVGVAGPVDAVLGGAGGVGGDRSGRLEVDVRTARFTFTGSRPDVRAATVVAALRTLLDRLSDG